MSEQQPPMNEEHPQADDFGRLTGHNYDGIQEYDNPTPAWWTWVFIASVFFSVCYMFLTLVAAGDLSPAAEYERAKIASLTKRFAAIGTLEPTEANILTYVNDEQWLAYGKGVFNGKCVTCHGVNAEGLSAPNLTDDAYIHIDSIEDIATVLIDGVVDKGMPAWGKQLHPNDIVMVSAYLASIRGTNVSGGKAAEGDVPPPWPEPGEEVPEAPDEAEDAQAAHSVTAGAPSS